MSPDELTDSAPPLPSALTPPAEERAANGLRGRTLLVALPLLVGTCFISVYADMVSRTVQFGVLQLAPPAVVILFALALLNRGLTRLLRRELLSRADILIIYAMLLVGVMVSTRGVIEKLIPPLAYLPYFATNTNRLNQYITQHLPGWALPFVPSANLRTPELIRAYYEGLRPGEPIPFAAWVGPLAAWFALIGCVLWVFACLATILRRQWMDNERISFPLTTLPLALIRDEVNGRSFFRERTMWLGFTAAILVFSLNGLQVNFPALPHFVLDFDVSALLTQWPWSQMDSIQLWLSLAAVGFFYFLPRVLLFSLWFFFVMTRVQDLITVEFGGVPVSIGTHDTRIWTGYQAAGAYLVLIAAQVRLGRPYFQRMWRTAFDRVKPLDDRNELMSYRAAILGLFFGFGGIIAWLSLAGMNPLLAALQMGIYLFVVAVIMTRAVCEAGLLMTETSFLPTHLLRLVFPLPDLGATNLSLVALTNTVFTRDLRGVLLSPLMDNQKMAGELHVRQRSLLLPLALTVVIAFVVASFFFLTLHYTRGGLNLYTYPNNNAGNMYNMARATISGDDRPPDSTAYGGLTVGVLVTLALVWMRANFPWFPLHPLAYAIAPTWAMFVFWFPCFIAWLIKVPVVRFGGITLFRRLQPFMLGMILGEFTAAVFWALMSIPAIGANAPTFPWP